MSKFEVLVQPIFIKPHPNADRLELGNIGSPDGWQVVVAKGRFTTGDLCAYIGENAVVPEWVLKQYGYWNEEKDIGMLAGSKGTRVKAVKLRDEFSLGIVLPVYCRLLSEDYYVLKVDETLPTEIETQDLVVHEGDNVAEFFGVTKYEAPIPVSMAGEVCNVHGYTLSYDIENWKKYPDTFEEGEEVVFTEKLHGTWAGFGWADTIQHDEIPDGKVIVTSKGLSDQGLAFKGNEANANNLYMKAYLDTADANGDTIIHRYHKLREFVPQFTPTVYFLGEIFGPVQDLRYGLTTPSFRLFDVYLGEPGRGRYLTDAQLVALANLLHIETVPKLYQGPFSIEVMNKYTDGKDTISGTHIREGMVMVRASGGVKRKSISQAYLLRKNKDATEFQ
jgi:RNA ligase (TIGR02306 family)